MISLNKNYKNLPTQLLWKISIRRRKKKKKTIVKIMVYLALLSLEGFYG